MSNDRGKRRAVNRYRPRTTFGKFNQKPNIIGSGWWRDHCDVRRRRGAISRVSENHLGKSGAGDVSDRRRDAREEHVGRTRRGGFRGRHFGREQTSGEFKNSGRREASASVSVRVRYGFGRERKLG